MTEPPRVFLGGAMPSILRERSIDGKFIEPQIVCYQENQAPKIGLGSLSYFDFGNTAPDLASFSDTVLAYSLPTGRITDINTSLVRPSLHFDTSEVPDSISDFDRNKPKSDSESTKWLEMLPFSSLFEKIGRFSILNHVRRPNFENNRTPLVEQDMDRNYIQKVELVEHERNFRSSRQRSKYPPGHGNDRYDAVENFASLTAENGTSDMGVLNSLVLNATPRSKGTLRPFRLPWLILALFILSTYLMSWGFQDAQSSSAAWLSNYTKTDAIVDDAKPMNLSSAGFLGNSFIYQVSQSFTGSI